MELDRSQPDKPEELASEDPPTLSALSAFAIESAAPQALNPTEEGKELELLAQTKRKPDCLFSSIEHRLALLDGDGNFIRFVD